MSRGTSPNVMVGNEFVLPSRQLRVITPAPAGHSAPVPVFNVPMPAEIVTVRHDTPVVETTQKSETIFHHGLEFLYKYWLGAFALLFLLVAVSGIEVAAMYETARLTPSSAVSAPKHLTFKPLKGPNMTVALPQLEAAKYSIAAQPINVTVGTKNVTIPAEAIAGWLKTVIDQKNKVAYIHVDEAAIAATLKSTTEPFAYAPVDSITVTRDDGSTRVLVSGRDGTSLTDTSALTKQISTGLLAAKGNQLNVPLQTIPFHALTQANFDKLIEVDVNQKKMWLYHNGTVERTLLVSAGAPETPTPLGQFHIRAKLPIQDMSGFNPNGTKYFQPHVRWINYFSGANAIHGNYWRPLSWFGVKNSSHGCVSVPDDEAKWVYDWAPMGTTVITHG